MTNELAPALCVLVVAVLVMLAAFLIVVGQRDGLQGIVDATCASAHYAHGTAGHLYQVHIGQQTFSDLKCVGG